MIFSAVWLSLYQFRHARRVCRRYRLGGTEFDCRGLLFQIYRQYCEKQRKSTRAAFAATRMASFDVGPLPEAALPQATVPES